MCNDAEYVITYSTRQSSNLRIRIISYHIIYHQNMTRGQYLQSYTNRLSIFVRYSIIMSLLKYHSHSYESVIINISNSGNIVLVEMLSILECRKKH